LPGCRFKEVIFGTSLLKRLGANLFCGRRYIFSDKYLPEPAIKVMYFGIFVVEIKAKVQKGGK